MEKKGLVELDNWITMPTNYGVEVTHILEEEKRIFSAVKDLLLKEINRRFSLRLNG